MRLTRNMLNSTMAAMSGAKKIDRAVSVTKVLLEQGELIDGARARSGVDLGHSRR